VIVGQLEEQKLQIATLKAKETARDIIAEEMAEAWVAPSTVARLTTELLADLPLVEEKLDETALRDRFVEARDRAELEAAETLDAAGFGSPRGLGSSTPPAGGDATKYNDSIAEGMSAAFGLSEAAAAGAVVFHAGTARKDGAVVTNGGRVLGVTAMDGDVLKAIEKAYAAVGRIGFKGAHYRKDIAYKVVERLRK
jgi:hypothetical protein